jgi:excinuclease ABC subunit A
VRQNNLKNFDLDLPLNRLIVFTGLSGSGKSSLAFDTLFAEGQRRYIETFSPYARQFFDRMDKPQIDRIDGIPPAIALEQRNTVRTTRSTVGTMTEICEYMKLVWPHLAKLHCRRCGQVVQKDTPPVMWAALTPGHEILVTFDLPLTEKLSLAESVGLIGRQGYQRLLLDGEPVRLDDALPRLKAAACLTVVQDRLWVTEANRSRFAEACEQAYHFGKGKLTVHLLPPAVQGPLCFSRDYHCARCDLSYREPSPALFSFNHPLGACPTCRGFGRIITIDYQRALPDRSRTLAEGVVRPWQTGQGAECQEDMMKFCRKLGVPTDVPFRELPQRWQDWVIEGDPEYGKDTGHEWPRAWYGVKGYFRWLESKAYKMHVRVLLSRYRAYSPCPDCHADRFQPETLLYRVKLLDEDLSGRPSDAPGQTSGPRDAPRGGLTLAEFYRLPLRDALAWVQRLAAQRSLRATDPLATVIEEVRARLAYLVQVGLAYLTLDRPTRSLSGGETQRVNLTTCLGTRLVNTLYVLDEPSVGLHPRDTGRLVQVLEELRDLGNTVVVVEHEASVIRAADQIVDLGPGQGERGGQVVFQGTCEELLRSPSSLTGRYLSGRLRLDPPRRRPVRADTPTLCLQGAERFNLRNLTVDIPLGRFVCVTGVSGSGKSTLVAEVLFPLLAAALEQVNPDAATEAEADTPEGESAADPAGAVLRGWEKLGRVVVVDQSPLGRTPRSNPAVYTGAFDEIREFYAQSPAARQRGLSASGFSFNSSEGQCERCRGAGFEKIEMQFLSDVFIRCPECQGRRYRAHVLEVRVPSADPGLSPRASRRRTTRSPGNGSGSSAKSWTIADALEATIDDAIAFFAAHRDSGPAQRAVAALQLLQEVGLGYLRMGQPVTTLSGGESQRLKLAGHLADFQRAENRQAKPTLFIFDEPTTGLHYDDVRVLLGVLGRLVDAGHSLIVVEHNLEVIRSADWIIDLGPEGGEQGGRLMAQGPPEAIVACAESHTGRALGAAEGSTAAL